MIDGNSMSWYVGGLHFECVECGACCAGPGEGYIWITKPEIEIISKFLKIPPGELRRKFLKRIGLRTTIIEDPSTKDCIFLQEIDGRKRCVIYPVRPSQCRSWPFWKGNLASPASWSKAGQKCSGVNHGRLYSFDEIQEIKREKKWWQDPKQKASS
jgi:Fe-S-cluster containining protein